MKYFELYRHKEQSFFTFIQLSTAMLLKTLTLCLMMQIFPVLAIYQGQPVVKGELPYVVSLQSIREDNAVEGHSCTASLIAPRFVLTAAHCVQNIVKLETKVLVKATNLETDPGLLFDIKHFIPHPNYQYDFSGSNINNSDDILLLELIEPVNLPLVKLAQFPLSGYANPGESLTGAGWGVTDNIGTKSTFLKKVQIQLMSDNECLQAWPGISESQFCTAGIDGNACQGDSGGPLFFKNGDELIQVGIYKAGSTQCSDISKGAATRVNHYIEWIEKEQRLSYPRSAVIDTVIIAKAQQYHIEIKNNYSENLPLNDFSFSTVDQAALIGEIEVLTNTCSGQTLIPEQTCAIDISFTPAKTGFEQIKFSSQTSNEEFPPIIGQLEYRTVDVEDVSAVIHQGVKNEQLTFTGNFAENWQVRDYDNSKNGVVAALPLSLRDYANLIVEIAEPGTVSIKLAIEKTLNSLYDPELWFTLNNKMVPISGLSHFVQKGATNGFITIELPINNAQSQLVLHLWNRASDATLLLEQFDLVSEPPPVVKPEPKDNASSGGSTGPLILLLTLIVFIFRLKA